MNSAGHGAWGPRRPDAIVELIEEKAAANLIDMGDRYLGGFGKLSLALAVVSWASGTGTYRSVLVFGAIAVVMEAISRLGGRFKNIPRLRFERVRTAVALVMVPWIFLSVEGPLFPWWPGYLLFPFVSATVVSMTFPTRKGGWAFIVLWQLNLALTSWIGLPKVDWYQLAYLVGISVSIAGFMLEVTFVLRGMLLKLDQEKRTIVALHEELAMERARGVNNAKMAALGEMAGGIAHEINNPLAIIQTNTEMLAETVAEEGFDREMAQGLIRNIGLTVSRAAGIVQGLRTFSRDASRDPAVPCQVAAIIGDTLSFCREKFGNSGVRVEVDQAPGLAVMARPVQISQVLLNLLNNAFDAVVEAGGAGERWIRIEAKEDGEWVDLAVVDSGKSVPQELREKIFQPFFTTKPVGKGTGLGLSVSQGIMESHGGSLALDGSSPHTRFVIRLQKTLVR